MSRCIPSAMEWLALFVLLGIALPTAGEVFESSLDRTSSKLTFQCAKVTAIGCRKQHPDMEVVLNSLIGSFGSGISCALNRTVSTSFRDLEYFFNENCLTKPIKIVILRLDESQIQEEATKSGCSVKTQRLSKLTVQYGCVSRSTVTITLTQPTSVRNETAASSRAQSTAAIYFLSSQATTGSSKQSIASSLPSTATMPLSKSTVKADVTTAHDKGVLYASTNARPTAAWSTAVDTTTTLPLTSSSASGTAEGTTLTMRSENSEKATTGHSNQAITSSFPSASTMLLTPTSVKTSFTTTHAKIALSTSTNVRPSAAWSTREAGTQMMPATSPGASAITTGITVTGILVNSASTTTNVSDRMMNQSLSTEPTNRRDPSQVVSNSDDWWQFFKTNEGITVAVVSLLVLCLTICGLALIFYSRSNKGTKRPGNTAPIGAFATTETYHEHSKGVPNGEEHAAELGINARSTLYVDAAAYGRPSVRPITTNEVLEHQGTLSLHSKNSFDGPARRQSAANGCNFASEPVAQPSPGSLHEDEHCAAIGDATGMLRPLEERRVSDHSPSVIRDQKQSAVEMTSEPTAGKGSGGMLAIENEEAYRASCAPPRTQFENSRAEAMQQLHANPKADETQQTSEYLPQKAWSTSEGSPKATPNNSFSVAVNVDVGEKSMDTAL